MKKRKLLIGLFSIFAVAGTLALASCNTTDGENTYQPTQMEQIYAQYVVYAQAEGIDPLSYETWLETVKGEQGPQGEQGEQGAQGETGRGIAKVEVIDGYLWVTYTDSETPVNVGKVVADDSEDESQGTEGLAYYPLPDGTYAVGQGNTIYAEEIVIPSTYKGKPVTAIVENGLKELSRDPEHFIHPKMKKITIPDSITSIGDGAFV